MRRYFVIAAVLLVPWLTVLAVPKPKPVVAAVAQAVVPVAKPIIKKAIKRKFVKRAPAPTPHCQYLIGC